VTSPARQRRSKPIIFVTGAVILLVLACCGCGALVGGADDEPTGRRANGGAGSAATEGATGELAAVPTPTPAGSPSAAPTVPSAAGASTASSPAAGAATRAGTTTRAAAPPTRTPTRAANCHPSYPTVCLKIVADLDCGEITHKRVPAKPDDPYRLDGDHDGIACE